MPSGRLNQTFYLGPFSGPDTFNSTTLFKPGELGSQFQVSGKAYQVVQLDSGAVAATGAGVVAAGQLAFWKDRSNYVVTNDKSAAIGGPTASNARNSYAGVFQVAGTAGNYVMVQQRGQSATALLTDSGTAAINDMLVPHTAATAGVLVVAQGTAPGSNVVGRATAATSTTTACFLGGWDVVEVP